MTQEFVALPREVVERALAAMESGVTGTDYDRKAQALRAALEQPQVEQEPVAWIENIGGGIGYNLHREAARKLPDGVRFDLYTHPEPKREPLTDDDVERLWYQNRGISLRFARAIERAHNIK